MKVTVKSLLVLLVLGGSLATAQTPHEALQILHQNLTALQETLGTLTTKLQELTARSLSDETLQKPEKKVDPVPATAAYEEETQRAAVKREQERAAREAKRVAQKEAAEQAKRRAQSLFTEERANRTTLNNEEQIARESSIDKAWAKALEKLPRADRVEIFLGFLRTSKFQEALDFIEQNPDIKSSITTLELEKVDTLSLTQILAYLRHITALKITNSELYDLTTYKRTGEINDGPLHLPLDILTQLNTVTLDSCLYMTTLLGVSQVKPLQGVHISDCWGFDAIPQLQATKMDISSCPDLSNVQISSNNASNNIYITNCESLATAECRDNAALTTLTLKDNEKLHEVAIHNCQNLKEVTITNPDARVKIYITNCQKLETVTVTGITLSTQDIENVGRQYTLTLGHCPNLRAIKIKTKHPLTDEQKTAIFNEMSNDLRSTGILVTDCPQITIEFFN